MNAMNVFRFLLALGLAPVVLGIARRIRMPGARPAFLIGFVAIVLAFGMAAGQPLWNTDFLRTLRHVTFGVGGLGLAWAAVEARRDVLASTGARR
jgi:hypothetical protein